MTAASRFCTHATRSLRRSLVDCCALLGLAAMLAAGAAADQATLELVEPSVAPPLELVETFPLETDLDHPDLPEAHEVWLEMIGAAQQELSFAQFYASNAPESRLEAVVQAILAAARRGVDVRFLAEKKFYATYPQTLDRLGAADGIEVRIFDVAALMGGVLHAKYFIVDSRQAYVGSQNFDWRALAHIQELGLRLREARLVAPLRQLFEMDWALAGGAPRAEVMANLVAIQDYPVVVSKGEEESAEPITVTPALSPATWLPDGRLWDLPQILRLIDQAEETVRVQLLTYRAVGRDGDYFAKLESALRRAAARGVRVEMLLADWSKRRGTIEGLQSLQVLPGIEVRLMTIPPWSGGFIPYARVIHAKYLVTDGRAAWLGSSNWERGYFHASRNVGLVISGGAIPPRLDRYFARNWESEYTETVDPCRGYTPPRIGE